MSAGSDRFGSVAQDDLRPAQGAKRHASAERTKAFTDAVVAIAMTLLILPLMESVVELSHDGGTATEWVQENTWELLVFVLSFGLIGAFWMSHHRLFERIHRVSGPLLVLNSAWMLTIVWLPVATATFGLVPVDAVQKVLYIGALFATSALLAVLGVYSLRHPELHDIPEENLRNGIVAELVATSTFAAILVIAIALPAVGYWAMALLVVMGPAQWLIRRYARR